MVWQYEMDFLPLARGWKRGPMNRNELDEIAWKTIHDRTQPEGKTL
jgi:hypothetical protein